MPRKTKEKTDKQKGRGSERSVQARASENTVPVSSLQQSRKYRIEMNNNSGVTATINISGYASLALNSPAPPYTVNNGASQTIYAVMQSSGDNCGASLVFTLSGDGNAFTNAYAPAGGADCASAVREVHAYNTSEDQALNIILTPC